MTPRLIGQIEITYTDGSVDTIASDRNWQTALGPTVTSTDSALASLTVNAPPDRVWPWLVQLGCHRAIRRCPTAGDWGKRSGQRMSHSQVERGFEGFSQRRRAKLGRLRDQHHVGEGAVGVVGVGPSVARSVLVGLHLPEAVPILDVGIRGSCSGGRRDRGHAQREGRVVIVDLRCATLRRRDGLGFCVTVVRDLPGGGLEGTWRRHL